MNITEKLHPYHVTLFVYMLQSGVGLFSLPRLLAETFGRNGWIILVGCGLIVSFNIWLMSLVYKKGNGKSIIDLFNQLLSSVIRYPIYIILSINWICLALFLLKNYVYISQFFSFQTTPHYLITALLLVTVIYFSLNSVYNMVKASTVFFYFSLVLIIFTLFLFGEVEVTRFTTFLLREGNYELSGIIKIYSSFLGFELCFFLFHLVNNGKSFFRAIYLGNGLTTVLYIYTSILVFGFLSFEQIKNIIYPTLEVFSYINVIFLTRVENLMIYLFLLKIIVTVGFFSWASAKMMQQVIPRVEDKWILIGLVTVVYLVFISVETIKEIGVWIEVFIISEAIIAFFLPICLLALLKFKSKGSEAHHA